MHDRIEKYPADKIQQSASMCAFFNEFAVAYQEPTDGSPERGYLTAWVTMDHTDDRNPTYERIQGMSGDDRMIRQKFREIAFDPNGVESFVP